MDLRFLFLDLNQSMLTLSHSPFSGLPHWKKKGPVNMTIGQHVFLELSNWENKTNI